MVAVAGISKHFGIDFLDRNTSNAKEFREIEVIAKAVLSSQNFQKRKPDLFRFIKAQAASHGRQFF